MIDYLYIHSFIQEIYISSLKQTLLNCSIHYALLEWVNDHASRLTSTASFGRAGDIEMGVLLRVGVRMIGRTDYYEYGGW